MTTHRICLLSGDGIGPEVTTAARRVLDGSGVSLVWDFCQIGQTAIQASGEPLSDSVVRRVSANGVALKGPVTTPTSGYRSVNLALRQRLGLYVQVRLCRSLPGVQTPFGNVDLAVIRETTEDLYSGVEFEHGSQAAETVRAAINAEGFDIATNSGLSVKATSERASQRASQFAFEWARTNKRSRVTIVHKATNIRCTDGLFLRVARQVGEAYPEIEVDDCLVDAAAGSLVRKPGQFDVILTQSVWGDILSDLAASLVGGVGVAPGANFGDGVALFEPTHGSAPRHAGTNRANPLATVLSGVMMLRHLGEHAAADRVESAVRATVESGTVTYDLGSEFPAGTVEVADAIVANLERS